MWLMGLISSLGPKAAGLTQQQVRDFHLWSLKNQRRFRWVDMNEEMARGFWTGDGVKRRVRWIGYKRS